MRRRCPTISELNAFIVSARQLSFSKAAKELFVTQSAISRHIAELETYLGHPLFIRSRNGLALTQIGEHFLKQVRPALHALESATTQVMSTARHTHLLNLSVAPTFAANWLLSRLAAFRLLNPDISINFVRYHTIDAMEAGPDHDASIQYGYGDWAIAEATYLIGKETSVVCSPEYRNRLAVKHFPDLKRCTLLQHNEIPSAWEDWFINYAGEYKDARIGPAFNLFTLIIQAAVSGFGIALVPSCLVQDKLMSGQLIEPFEQRFESPLGYYLCAPNHRSNMDSYRRFGEWLHHECCHIPSAQHPTPEEPTQTPQCRYCRQSATITA
ncbi:Gcv operon activator [Delftia tsuruhatensis]|uniref:LysR substrate-binding domain-containing protein n=1 Tax=Delftia tsuruhatensis TaxID=180282 RepID=UPI001E6B725F|nr:LysR substrate-binding domain-containing protein [Delftia tsuruhatensis]CAB5714761.1 Gcv operon activator [Delftia tsuruhatensis]CAC9689207.1 Gcv operon activator [Delftia tsuruhatensis]